MNSPVAQSKGVSEAGQWAFSLAGQMCGYNALVDDIERELWESGEKVAGVVLITCLPKR